MTFWWLIVWLLDSTPRVVTWNGWAIALAVCAFIDITKLVRSA